MEAYPMSDNQPHTPPEESMPPKEMIVQDVRPAEIMKLTAAQVKADVQLIQEVLRSVMVEGVHYGTIPGTPKPTLYKPGAEKIMATFRLAGEPIIEDLSTADEIRYRVSLRLTHQVTSLTVGYGVGECSSSETKYKWIRPVCDAEYDETPEDRKRAKWTKRKDGAPYQNKQIRAERTDVANTILKMAKKRALVDATLTCTAASDIFDQDLEDLPEGLRQNVADAQRPAMPQRNTEKAPPLVDEANDSLEDPPAKPKSAIDFSKGISMPAKFTADCKRCGKKVMEGDPQIYIREGVDKGPYHVACAKG
jgi:hypothetical protein